eukprot:5367816-Lingulodinium_polyedra.AAC.1
MRGAFATVSSQCIRGVFGWPALGVQAGVSGARGSSGQQATVREEQGQEDVRTERHCEEEGRE